MKLLNLNICFLFYLLTEVELFCSLDDAQTINEEVVSQMHKVGGVWQCFSEETKNELLLCVHICKSFQFLQEAYKVGLGFVIDPEKQQQ